LDSCIEPAPGPILEAPTERETQPEAKEVKMATARVGKVAPDFEASAFVDGGFKSTRKRHRRGNTFRLATGQADA
jgi:hypothetical protein